MVCGSRAIETLHPHRRFTHAGDDVVRSGSVIGLSKIMPSVESYGAMKDDFLGSHAQALFDITAEFGQIEARGPYGNLLTLRCITREGAEVVPKGSTVVIEQYDEEREVFLVTREPFEELESGSSSDEISSQNRRRLQ